MKYKIRGIDLYAIDVEFNDKIQRKPIEGEEIL